jgi:hypothetical protein
MNIISLMCTLDIMDVYNLRAKSLSLASLSPTAFFILLYIEFTRVARYKVLQGRCLL